MDTNLNLRNTWIGLLSALLVLLIGSSAMAQDEPVSLDAEISRSRAYIGDVISYQVLVRGAEDSTPPSIKFPEGVIAEYRGASSQKFTTMRSINGRQRSQTDAYYKHQYLLTVLQDGVIEIPPAVLVHNKQRYQSEPVRVTALLPEYSAKDRIEIELPDRPVYAGETVLAHVNWWVADQTQGLSFESSIFPESFQVKPISPDGTTAQEHELNLYGQRFLAHVDQMIYQGQPTTRLRFDLQLTPTQIGDFELGPIRVVFTRQDDFARASRMYAESKKRTVRVIDVPAGTRPDGYQGMIGVFGAQTDASNTQVNVGDPIEFRVLVKGPEPMLGLEKTINTQSLESKGFRVAPDGWREIERSQAGERLFTTTIRATDESITEIPPITLPAFNPETGKFEVFASGAIPLEVNAVRQVTLSDAIVSGSTNNTNRSESDAKNTRAQLVKNPSLLWSHPDADAIRGSSRAFSLRDTLADPVWIGTLGVIGGVPLASLLILGVRRRRDPRETRIHRAWKEAKRLHKQGDDVNAIRVYGGAILDIDPDSLTGADLKRLRISQDIVQRSSVVLSESESVHYGSLPEAHSDASLLEAMRRDFRRHGAGPRPSSPRRVKR